MQCMLCTKDPCECDKPAAPVKQRAHSNPIVPTRKPLAIPPPPNARGPTPSAPTIPPSPTIPSVPTETISPTKSLDLTGLFYSGPDVEERALINLRKHFKVEKM